MRRSQGNSLSHDKFSRLIADGSTCYDRRFDTPCGGRREHNARRRSGKEGFRAKAIFNIFCKLHNLKGVCGSWQEGAKVNAHLKFEEYLQKLRRTFHPRIRKVFVEGSGKSRNVIEYFSKQCQTVHARVAVCANGRKLLSKVVGKLGKLKEVTV